MRAQKAAVEQVKRRNVLVIDDVPFNSRLYFRMLRPLGYDVRIANNVLEAVLQINAEIPDAIILNHEMIRSEWQSFAQDVKDNLELHGIPLIAVVRDREEPVIRSIMETGYDHFVLRKDVSKAGYLQSTVQRLLATA